MSLCEGPFSKIPMDNRLAYFSTNQPDVIRGGDDTLLASARCRRRARRSFSNPPVASLLCHLVARDSHDDDAPAVAAMRRPYIGDTSESDISDDDDVSDAEDAALRRRVRERAAEPCEIWRSDARARARSRGGRRRARGAVRRRVRAQRGSRRRAGREHRPRGPRARQAPRRAGRARRVLHPRALPSPVRLAPTVGSRPPPEQDVVQGRPPARVHRVHLLPLLPPEDHRRQDAVRVRRVAPRTPRRTRPRHVVRPLPRDAHGREHRGGARRPRVAMPRVPRHLQLQRRQLPPRQARSVPDPAAHPRGALARMAVRRALPHRHQGGGIRRRVRAPDLTAPEGAARTVRETTRATRRFRRRRRWRRGHQRGGGGAAKGTRRGG